MAGETVARRERFRAATASVTPFARRARRAGARSPARPDVPSARGDDRRDEARRADAGTRPLGPVLRAAPQDPEGLTCESCTAPSISTCPARSAGPCTCSRSPKGSPRSATRSTSRRSRAAAGRPAPSAGTPWVRRSAGRSCAGCAPARLPILARARRGRRRHGALLQLRRRGRVCGGAARAARGPRSERPDRRLPRLAETPPRPRAASSNRCGAGATASPGTCNCSSRPRRTSCPPWVDRKPRARDRVGRRRRALPPARERRAPLRRRSEPGSVRVRRGVPLVARRRAAVGHAGAASRSRATIASAPSSSATARSARPPSGSRAACRASRSRARFRTPSCRRRWRRPTSASRRSTRCATRRCGWVSTGRRSRSTSTWPSAFRSSRRPSRGCKRLVEHGREGLLYDPAEPRGLDHAIVSLADAALRRRHGRGGAGARRSRLQLGRALRGAGRPPARAGRPMSVPLNVLVVTDSFPPVCGGSGWSTWELVRGLQGRGHHVEVVKVADRIAGGRRVGPPRIGAGHDVPPHGAERARASQHGQERSALARPDHATLTRPAAGRPRRGHHPRAARDDDGAVGAGRRGDRHAGRRHGARLLAGVLLVGSRSTTRRSPSSARNARRA